MTKYNIEYEITRNGDPKVYHNKIDSEEVMIISVKHDKAEIRKYEFYQEDTDEYRNMIKFILSINMIEDLIADPIFLPDIKSIFMETIQNMKVLEEEKRRNITMN